MKKKSIIPITGRRLTRMARLYGIRRRIFESDEKLRERVEKVMRSMYYGGNHQ